jgi:glucan endo-1,3-alpha-glucosidase
MLRTFTSLLFILIQQCIPRSGSNAPVSINVAAGVHTVSAAMGIGSQVFSLSRNGATVMTGTGGLVISATCTANNFNSYVGTVTA